MTQSIKCLSFKDAELCWISPEPQEDHVLFLHNPRVIEGVTVALGAWRIGRLAKSASSRINGSPYLKKLIIQCRILEEDS